MINKWKLRTLRDLGQNALKKNPSLLSYHQMHSTESLADSVKLIKKDFKSVAYVGPYPEYFFSKMGDDIQNIEKIFIIDYSTSQLERAKKVLDKYFQNYENLETYYMIVDHDLWPFKPKTLDLIVDNLSLHLCSDVQVSLKRLLIS